MIVISLYYRLLMLLFALLWGLLWGFHVEAVTFQEAMDLLKKHENVGTLRSQSQSLRHQAGAWGSWEDPFVHISAKNFPKTTLRAGESPMTGLEFGIGQKIDWMGQRSHRKQAFKAASKAMEYKARNKLEELKKFLWTSVIMRRKILDEKKIIDENLKWVSKILEISQKLYANGKVPQKTIFDIQIRKSEIEILSQNIAPQLSQWQVQLSYLTGIRSLKIDKETIPWELLGHRDKKDHKNRKDYRGLELVEKTMEKDYRQKAAKLNILPSFTVGLSLTKRSDLDRHGDFVGIKLKWPLSLWPQKYESYERAVHDKITSLQQMEAYKKTKERDVSILKNDLLMIESEIHWMIQKNIPYSKSLKSIISKSYELGQSDYVELIQSEIKLQDVLLRKVSLEAQRDIKKVQLKYILGELLI